MNIKQLSNTLSPDTYSYYMRESDMNVISVNIKLLRKTLTRHIHQYIRLLGINIITVNVRLLSKERSPLT